MRCRWSVGTMGRENDAACCKVVQRLEKGESERYGERAFECDRLEWCDQSQRARLMRSREKLSQTGEQARESRRNRQTNVHRDGKEPASGDNVETEIRSRRRHIRDD